MSPTTRQRGRARATAADVVGHVVDRDVQGVLVAEDVVGDRVAHQQHVDAGGVDDAGARLVVGGDHDERLGAVAALRALTCGTVTGRSAVGLLIGMPSFRLGWFSLPGGRAIGGGPAPGRVLAGEVVPGARRAHLDLVAEDRLLPAAQPVELGHGPRAPAARRQPGTEDVGHLDGPGRLADRAVVARASGRRCGPPAAARDGRRRRPPRRPCPCARRGRRRFGPAGTRPARLPRRSPSSPAPSGGR